MRIEICGGIAAGKTTLAIALEKLGYRCVYEDLTSLKILKDFYSDPSLYTFETEIMCLLQHVYQIKARKIKSGVLFTDFSLEQDFAYAFNNLTVNEQCAFDAVYTEVINQLLEPELIIYLKCDPLILKNRIVARGRSEEQGISVKYIENIICKLEERLGDKKRQVISIDTGKYDLRDMKVVNKVVITAIKNCLPSLIEG